MYLNTQTIHTVHISNVFVCFSVQDLFKKVVPYHCLGGIWSQRDKKGKEHLAPTIRATVAQFNSVTNCVITTCLSNPTLKPNQRARLLERWIDVARVSKHRQVYLFELSHNLKGYFTF